MPGTTQSGNARREPSRSPLEILPRRLMKRSRLLIGSTVRVVGLRGDSKESPSSGLSGAGRVWTEGKSLVLPSRRDIPQRWWRVIGGLFLVCGVGGCAPSLSPQGVVGLPGERVIELPAPGSECNGVVSCQHPLRGGCVLTIAHSVGRWDLPGPVATRRRANALQASKMSLQNLFSASLSIPTLCSGARTPRETSSTGARGAGS